MVGIVVSLRYICQKLLSSNIIKKFQLVCAQEDPISRLLSTQVVGKSKDFYRSAGREEARERR